MKREHIDKYFPDTKWADARSEFDAYFNAERARFDEAIEALAGLLKLLLRGSIEPTPKISARVKERAECVKKFELKYLGELEKTGVTYDIKDHISDILGIRIVCIYEDDIERVAGIIRQELDVIEETDKSGALEIHDNQFGYKGLHLDCKLNSDRAPMAEYKRISDMKFEVQVRSIVQDAWSEVDHRLKYKKRVPTGLKRRINRLAALFELADQEFQAIRDDTSFLEEKAKNKKGAVTEEAALNPFNFGPAVQGFFDGFDVDAFKVDGFVDELVDCDEDLTNKGLETAVAAQLEQVEDFSEYLVELGHRMNPFTKIRHCLYLQNKVLYQPLMRVGPQKNFDRWLDHGTVHPKEVEILQKYTRPNP